MNLKNYRTEVPASRSIEAIERLLVGFGSTNIMKEYGPGGSIDAISFLVNMDGMILPFRLPARVDKCCSWLRKKKPKAPIKTVMAQAERICWKQIYEWVQLQLSMIELEQAEKLEMFFPFLYDVAKRENYYQKLKAENFKQLTNG